MDTRTQLDEIVMLLEPCFSKLYKAVYKYYKDAIIPVMVKPSHDMDFAKVFDDVNLDNVEQVCEACALWRTGCVVPSIWYVGARRANACATRQPYPASCARILDGADLMT